jgi:hypothetical protein
MAEPTAQRMRVTFTVKRADNGRFVIACDPLESESAPVIQGSDPTETEAVIRGSERDPALISRVFAFELQEGVTEEQAIYWEEASHASAPTSAYLRRDDECETRRLSLVGRPFEVVSAGRDGEALRPTRSIETEVR